MNKKTFQILKRKLLKSIKLDDEKHLKRMPSSQALALYYFFQDPSDFNYVFYTVQEVKAGRDKLIDNGVPEDKLPEKIRGADWEERIWMKFGMELPVEKETPLPPPKEKVKEEAALPQPAVEENVQKKKSLYGNPFASDKFGTLQGEPLDGDVPLVNRVKIR